MCPAVQSRGRSDPVSFMTRELFALPDPEIEMKLREFLPQADGGKQILIYGVAGAGIIAAATARGYKVRRMAASSSPANVAGGGDAVAVSDIERTSIVDRADYVVCLVSNLHFRNPLRAIETLSAAAAEGLVLLLEDPPASHRWGFDKGVALSGLLKRLPGLMLLPAGHKHNMDQGFAVSTPLIESFLKSLRQDFASVLVVEIGDGRRLVLARKRRIRHLHILAGVNAVGKSTLLDGLQAKRLPALAQDLGMDLNLPWTYTTFAALLKNSDTVEHSNLLVQYNITTPALHGPMHGHHHGLLDLILCAEHVDISTMWLPHAKQRQRYFSDRVPTTLLSPELYQKRKAGKLRDKGGDAGPKSVRSNPFYFRSRYTRRKAERLLGIYDNQSAFTAMYREWMDFVQAHASTARVIFQDPDYRVGTIADWEDRAAAADPSSVD